MSDVKKISSALTLSLLWHYLLGFLSVLAIIFIIINILHGILLFVWLVYLQLVVCYDSTSNRCLTYKTSVVKCLNLFIIKIFMKLIVVIFVNTWPPFVNRKGISSNQTDYTQHIFIHIQHSHSDPLPELGKPLNNNINSNDVNDRNSVHKLRCSDCNSVYIGKTGWTFKSTSCEHQL